MLTGYMCFDKSRNFIQNQLGNINLSHPLLERTRTMRNDLEKFIDKNLIRRNLRIPRINEFFDNDSDKGVELMVYVVGAREGRQKLLQGRRAVRLGTKNTTDECCGRFVADYV